MVTFAEALQLTLTHVREQHKPLGQGGVWAVSPEGTEDADFWAVIAGDSRYIVDGDNDYALVDDLIHVVHKSSGIVLHESYIQDPDRFDAMKPVSASS